MSEHAAVLKELDDAQCLGMWVEAARIAKIIIEDPSMAARAHLAEALSEIELAYHATGKLGLEPTPELQDVSIQVQKNLHRYILDQNTTEVTPDILYQCAVLEAHLLLWRNETEQALEVLESAKEPTVIETNYTRVCILRARTVVGSAQFALGDTKAALQSFNSVTVSQETLETNPEAARYALRLYEKQLHVLRAAQVTNEFHLKVLKNYFRVAEISLLPFSAEHMDEYEAILTLERGKNVPEADVDQQLHEVGRLRLIQAARALETVCPDETVLNGNGKVALKESLLHQQMMESKTLENEAEEMMAEWSKDVSRELPHMLLTSSRDVERTRELFRKIDSNISKSFISPRLMRMQTELLVALGNTREALVAFETYVSYQKLQVLKKKNGAFAAPDSELAVADIFCLIFDVIFMQTSEGTLKQTDSIKRIYDIYELMPKSDPEAIARAHGVLACAYLFEVSRAAGTNYVKDRLEHAKEHIGEALKASTPRASFLLLYGLYLVMIVSARESFEFVKGALERSGEFLPLWRLLVLLLTAQNEHEQACTICETVLERAMDRLESQDLPMIATRAQILDLKIIHVATLEASKGIHAALDALPETVDLFSELFPEMLARLEPDAPADATPQTKAPRTSTSRVRSVALRAKNNALPLTGSASSKVSQPPNQPSPKTNTTPVSPEVLRVSGDLWIWISRLYLRAELHDDAADAARTAASIDPENTEVEVLRGQLKMHSHPRDAWLHFTVALTMDQDNVNAAVGQAMLLDAFHAHKKETEGHCLFESRDEEMGAVHMVLGVLEDMTSRYISRRMPESWYQLGLLYERMGDIEASRNAFWKTVALTERMGVRSYV